MPDDPTTSVDLGGSILLKEFIAAGEKGDCGEVRRLGSALLAIFQEGAHSEMRSRMEYLVGDAIVGCPTASEEDLRVAIEHLESYAGSAVDAANMGQVYLKIGRARVRWGRFGQEHALQLAVAAFDRAKTFLSADADQKRLGEAYVGIAEAYEHLGNQEFLALQSALAAYKMAHQIYGNTKRYNEGVIAYRMGRLEVRLFEISGDQVLLQDALVHLERAETIYRVAQQRSQQRDAIELLSVVKAKLATVELGATTRRSKFKIGSRGLTTVSMIWTRWTTKIRSIVSNSALLRVLRAPLERTVLPEPYKLTSNERQLPQAEFDEAMLRIRQPDSRKMFLEKFLDLHDPADAERAEFLLNHVILPLDSETAAMHQAAIRRGDANLLKQAEEHGAMAIHYAKILLERDRERSTHSQAVEVLRNHLKRDEPFILFLRNFDIEITKGALPKEREARYRETYGATLVKVVTTELRRCLPKEQLGSTLAKDCPVIEVSDIADALDLDTSRDVSKLRVLSAEWELVVSMLVAEASSIVVFVTRLADGVFKELEIIERFSCEDRTTVLMIKPDLTLDIVASTPAETDLKVLAFDVIRHALECSFRGLPASGR
jgi:hypothetical protein